MFKIGDFSTLSHVSIRMLRYYDEMNILKPAEVDKFTNYRLYSAKQIHKLNKIVALRDMGFLVAEIKEILENYNDDILLQKLEYKRQEICNTISSENQKLLKIDNIIKYIGMESVNMDYEISIKNIPSYKVLSLREVIPNYMSEGILWEKMGKFMQKENIQCSKNKVCFAIYHDEGHKDTDVDIEILTPVDKLGESKDSYIFKESESVPCVTSIMVHGPFENIDGGFCALAQWIEEHNEYIISGKYRQICHRGPWNESDPQNYLTEILIPVTKILPESPLL